MLIDENIVEIISALVRDFGDGLISSQTLWEEINEVLGWGEPSRDFLFTS